MSELKQSESVAIGELRRAEGLSKLEAGQPNQTATGDCQLSSIDPNDFELFGSELSFSGQQPDSKSSSTSGAYQAQTNGTKIKRKRHMANERERERTKSLNEALERLRNRLPVLETEKRSKIQTLRTASQYIQFLKWLRQASRQDQSAHVAENERVAAPHQKTPVLFVNNNNGNNTSNNNNNNNNNHINNQTNNLDHNHNQHHNQHHNQNNNQNHNHNQNQNQNLNTSINSTSYAVNHNCTNNGGNDNNFTQLNQHNYQHHHNGTNSTNSHPGPNTPDSTLGYQFLKFRHLLKLKKVPSESAS